METNTNVTIGSLDVEWRGPEFVEHLKWAANEGLLKAADGVSKKMKENIGIQGVVPERRSNLTGEQSARRSYPGEFPRMESRSLRDSIQIAQLAGLAVGIGVNKDAINVETGDRVNDYALTLEFGTAFVAARPWILRTLIEQRGNIFGTFVEETARRLHARDIVGSFRGVS